MQQPTDVIELAKEYIPDPRHRIRLDDLVVAVLRKVLSLTTAEHFPSEGVNFSPEEFVNRLGKYESITAELQKIIILLAHWGTEEHLPVLRKTISRIAEHKRSNGVSGWLNLRWYPSLLLLYTGGIAAIASGQYRNLSILLTSLVESEYSDGRSEPVIMPIAAAMAELNNAFKLLPGHDRNYAPRSEYLFKVLRPDIDNLLFPGQSYEMLFDRFEVFFALVYADFYDRNWGPPGRFAYKYRMGSGVSPFVKIIEEAAAHGKEWAPLKAGLFRSSHDRFQKVSQQYGELMGKLNWF